MDMWDIDEVTIVSSSYNKIKLYEKTFHKYTYIYRYYIYIHIFMYNTQFITKNTAVFSYGIGPRGLFG